jgi:hypothetical protein
VDERIEPDETVVDADLCPVGVIIIRDDTGRVIAPKG